MSNDGIEKHSLHMPGRFESWGKFNDTHTGCSKKGVGLAIVRRTPRTSRPCPIAILYHPTCSTARAEVCASFK